MKKSLLLIALFTLSFLGCKKDEEVIPPPSIVSFTPETGFAGSAMLITGKNFSNTPAENSVTFVKGDVSAKGTVSSATPTSVEVSLPETLAPGQYTIAIEVKGKTGTSSTAFTVIAKPTVVAPGQEAMRIDSLSATAGQAGSTFTITGANFSAVAGEMQVSFTKTGSNPFLLTVLEATASQLKVKMPDAIAPDTYKVVVKKGDAVAEAGKAFTVSAPSVVTPAVPAPTVTSFSPTTAAPGSQVIITGTNFSTVASGNEVSLVTGTNTPVAVTVSSATATSLAFTVPAGLAPGAYTIRVKVGAQSADAQTTLTIAHPAPTVTSFSPVAAYAGGQVTITGTHFSTTAADNQVSLVAGNTSVAATVSQASATNLTFSVPATIAPGTFTVRVSVGGRSADGQTQFTVLAPSTAPTISSFSPASAEKGAIIEINGTNFSATPASNRVDLEQNGFTFPATVVSATATKLTVMLPAEMFSGQYYIEVTVDGKKVRSTGQFTLAAFSVPTITSITPASVQRGGSITITGTNFSPNKDVLYVKIKGSFTYLTITSSTSTSITAEFSAYQPAGSYYIEVHKGNGKAISSQPVSVVQ